jgi:tetratricopeptide (TPR) repeat protein
MRFTSNEDGVPQSYSLREGSTIIGRHPSCHICVSGRNVSKRHLQVYVENGVVTIRDLGSANGTTVNGNPVTSCVLDHGDEVSLGGFRLSLDTADVEAAPAPPSTADPYAATATFDYEPSGARAAEPPGDMAGPGADAGPIDFKQEPSADDTPADGQFVPQAYAGPQALQPQVVARDGHMFLRDPRTNREVEIVPRGSRASADLSGYYAEQDAAEGKRNQYLVWAAIGVAVLLIIALAVTSTQNEPDVLVKPRFPRGDYNKLVDGSVELMSKGEFKKAIAGLKVAQKGRPTWQVADALLQVAEKWQESGKSFDEFNWLSIETPLRELERGSWSTSKVRTFAKERIERIYDLRQQEADAARAAKLLATGEPEKALAEFAKLPKDSLVHAKVAPLIAEAVSAAFNKHLRLGQSALRSRKWDGAIASFRAAEQYATNVQKTDIVRGIRTARKRQREEADLRAAHMRMREHTISSLKAAAHLLRDIEDSGPLGTKKAELQDLIARKIEEIKEDRTRALALSSYQSGDGVKAISIITTNQLTDLYALRSRIEAVMKIIKAAEAAEKARDWDLAKEKWLAAQREETLSKNAYNRQSVNALTALTSRAKSSEIANDYNKRADTALRKDDPEAARKLYLIAMKWDPAMTIGKDGLADLRHLAEITYRKARDHRHAGEKRQAIKLFEKVLRYVPEGATRHKDAKRQLAELRMESD